MTFAQVKSNYEKSLWIKEMVRAVVGRVITKAQYKEVTGEDY